MNIVNKLYEEEMVEWRKLAMWGLTLDDADRDRIKAAVHQRFLRDGMSVHDWMNDGVAAATGFLATKAEFRAMAKTAFAPKEEARPAYKSTYIAAVVHQAGDDPDHQWQFDNGHDIATKRPALSSR